LDIGKAEEDGQSGGFRIRKSRPYEKTEFTEAAREQNNVFAGCLKPPGLGRGDGRESGAENALVINLSNAAIS